MTGCKTKINTSENRQSGARGISALTTAIILALSLAMTVFLSENIAISVKEALLLCANVIIPSVFPFMILSDLLYHSLDFGSLRWLGDLFERIFKVNRAGLYPFTLGIICGFPLGVRCAAELYSEDCISRDECERLIGFCNNTGPAFLICGIGIGLRGSISDGIALYLITVLSAIITGMLFSYGRAATDGSYRIKRSGAFSIVSSVKNAGIGSLNICSYLTFFACITGILRAVLSEGILYILIIPFLEVGGATAILSRSELLSAAESLALSAFAVCFSGLSVHLQALSFLSGTDIRCGRYYLMKLTQGMLAAIMAFAAYFLYNRFR